MTTIIIGLLGVVYIAEVLCVVLFLFCQLLDILGNQAEQEKTRTDSVPYDVPWC